VFADLFTGEFGQDLTYYYGYSAANLKQFPVDTTGRSGGEDRFDEYSLGTVTISDGRFDIYFQDADERTFTAAAESMAALKELYGSPWNNDGPFRLYETAASDSGHPVYYADFLEIPGHVYVRHQRRSLCLRPA
jgi:hypothetical protein